MISKEELDERFKLAKKVWDEDPTIYKLNSFTEVMRIIWDWTKDMKPECRLEHMYYDTNGNSVKRLICYCGTTGCKNVSIEDFYQKK